RPNYPLTSDGGDEVQLTDGAYSVGTPLWTRATSVGWVNAAPVTIVIDLGSIQPIAGVSFSTAAGTAGVLWPRSIFVMVSGDGRPTSRRRVRRWRRRRSALPYGLSQSMSWTSPGARLEPFLFNRPIPSERCCLSMPRTPGFLPSTDC